MSATHQLYAFRQQTRSGSGRNPIGGHRAEKLPVGSRPLATVRTREPFLIADCAERHKPITATTRSLSCNLPPECIFLGSSD